MPLPPTGTITIVQTMTRPDSDTDFTNLTYEELQTVFVDIQTAPYHLNMKRPDYVRRILLEGKLEGVKVELSGYSKWFISYDSILYYNEHKSKRNSKRRWFLRMDKKHEAGLRAYLDTVSSGYTLELAYKPRKDSDEL